MSIAPNPWEQAEREEQQREGELFGQMANITQRLIEARERAGLTQGQTAKLAGFEGGASSFQGYESGRTPLTMKLFLRLCQIYGISPTWALTGVNPAFDEAKAMELAGRLGSDAYELTELLRSIG